MKDKYMSCDNCNKETSILHNVKINKKDRYLCNECFKKYLDDKNKHPDRIK